MQDQKEQELPQEFSPNLYQQMVSYNPLVDTDPFSLYYKKCPGAVSIKHEDMLDGGITVYLESPRFEAVSICSPQVSNFNDLSEDIKTLYSVTFGDSDVMAKYNRCEPSSEENFMKLVNLQSQRSLYGNPFVGCIIYDKESYAKDKGDAKGKEVIAYAALGNSGKPNTASLGYLLNKNYHNNNSEYHTTYSKGKDIKYAGTEIAGLFSLYYGQYLSDTKQLVNQLFDEASNSFKRGEPLKKTSATAKEDNIASWKIQKGLGFKPVDYTINDLGHCRYELQVPYENGAFSCNGEPYVCTHDNIRITGNEVIDFSLGDYQ